MEQPIQKIEEHKLKIIEIIDEALNVKTFRLQMAENVKISFFPGQFFMVRFEDAPKMQRAYSIASSPEKNHLDITMNLVGEFTNRLFKANVGDYLIFKGPYGKFYFNEQIKNDITLIGGGLGITPLMSLIRYCNDKKLPNSLNLIYSVKTSQDIIYYNEIKKIKGQNKNFNYAITITRPNAEDKWDGMTGRINLELLKQNTKNIEKSLYYICGPLDFVKSMIAMLESLNVKKGQIKTDIWG
ncbi:hypothetical protein HYX01_03505 [Candidatus Woesearchaeota archaeon]|nr:hypothetical protein [Candidatus Woesearchaeota archaeon]